MKVINDLLGYDGLKIVQDTKWFSFSLESVLLPNFISLNKNISAILDLGTGNAPIPMILSTMVSDNVKIFGIELQKDVYDLAIESLKINNLSSRINIINDDMKNLNNYFQINSFDVILCNPPYFKLSELSKKNDDIHKSIARHELKIELEDIIKIASRYLKNDGTFGLVHRTDRLIEIIDYMDKYNIEPKRMQFIYPKKNTNSNMVLIEGRKNGNPGLKVLEPLIIHDDNGKYLEIIDKKYFRR